MIIIITVNLNILLLWYNAIQYYSIKACHVIIIKSVQSIAWCYYKTHYIITILYALYTTLASTLLILIHCYHDVTQKHWIIIMVKPVHHPVFIFAAPIHSVTRLNYAVMLLCITLCSDAFTRNIMKWCYYLSWHNGHISAKHHIKPSQNSIIIIIIIIIVQYHQYC
jgi:hypothetical protein